MSSRHPKPATGESPASQRLTRRRRRLACPRCAQAVRRRPRAPWHRWLPGAALGHYRCTNAQCGWTGLLQRRWAAATASAGGSADAVAGTGASPPAHETDTSADALRTASTSTPLLDTGTGTLAGRRRQEPLARHRDGATAPGRHGGVRARAVRGIAPLVLAGLALGAAHWGASQAPVAEIHVGPRLFALGEAFDGEALPPEHPLLLSAAYIAEGSAPGGAAGPGLQGAGAAATHAPLALKRFCAWGRPGRMPYRGTAEEALRSAQVDPTARAQLLAALAAQQPRDRLLIANDGIHAAASGRVFEPDGLAMTYGRTMCLGTRVNFKPGHTEPASLYEAFDASGRRISMMVPDVCGNVTLIKERVERGAPTPQRPTFHAEPWDPGGPKLGITQLSKTDKPNEVPTPGTLVLSLLALCAALAARRRNAGTGAGTGAATSSPPRRVR